MFKLMQCKVLFLGLEVEKEVVNFVFELSFEMGIVDFEFKVEIIGLNGFFGVESLNFDVGRSGNEENGSGLDLGLCYSGGLGMRGERIREILERELKFVELDIEDIFYQYVGYMGFRGSDGEIYFNLKIVFNEFEVKSLVKRYRMIYGLL